MKTFARDFTIFLLILAGCYLFYKHSGFFQYEHNTMQYMPNMYRTPAYVPLRGSEFFEDGLGARTPPEGTLSQTAEVYPYGKVAADRVARRPSPIEKSKEVLARGKQMYMTYCVVCHGERGLGNGYVVPPFPQPPTLHSDKVRGYADSQIYHIITVGQNTMNSYAAQIKPKDRWPLIHYIRALQLAENPSQGDLRAYKQTQEGGNK